MLDTVVSVDCKPRQSETMWRVYFGFTLWGCRGTKLWPNNMRKEEFLCKSHTLLLLTSRSHVVKLVLNLANNFYKSSGKFVSVENFLKKKNMWEIIILIEVLFSNLLNKQHFPKMSLFPTSSTF